MTKVSNFIAANTKPGYDYLGDAKIALEGMTDAEFDALLLALDVLNGGATEPGIDCGLVLTYETLSDYDEACRKNWAECRSRRPMQLGGFNATYFTGVQLRRGEQRRDMLVLDLGDRRIVLN